MEETRLPVPIELPFDGPPVLACGADVKNRFCVTRGNRAFMSRDMGDLAEYASYSSFRQEIDALTGLLGVAPQIVAYDMHPDYHCTRYAQESGIANKAAVQHHHAHVAACMVEHRLDGKVIGVALDGTGYGADGTVWGGEFLAADFAHYRRVGHFKQYRMPGGEEAIRDPARMALSCLSAELGRESNALGKRLFPGIPDSEREMILRMAEKGIRSPLTSSAGRLFDAVSAIAGLCGRISCQGEAAIRLQSAARMGIEERYDFNIEQGGDCAVLSFGPMIRQIAGEAASRADAGMISARFHNTVAEGAAEMCEFIRSSERMDRVVLSGGVFQNDLLRGLAADRLRARGFDVYAHGSIPAGDGGLAVGQAAIALARSF